MPRHPLRAKELLLTDREIFMLKFVVRYRGVAWSPETFLRATAQYHDGDEEDPPDWTEIMDSVADKIAYLNEGL
jgi:hypothetical protein